jgi:hypothetical protein
MIHALIVPSEIKDACNQAAHELAIDPDATLDTLCVPLVPVDGPDDAEPTHWGACGQIPEEARLWLADNLGMFPGAFWWRWGGNRRLLASSKPGDLGKFWNWNACLTEVGLKVRVVPMLMMDP